VPIIPGALIQTRISKRAQEIIDQMVTVRAARWEYRLSRKQFLTQWAKMRKALRLTRDYQSLLDRVAARAKGMCECGCNRPGAHVHHIVPVAYDPKLALTDTNTMFLSRRCHTAEHRKMDAANRRPSARTGSNKPPIGTPVNRSSSSKGTPRGASPQSPRPLPTGNA
jgi:5-methylcytosine-specific restriction endonuclease McrA